MLIFEDNSINLVFFPCEVSDSILVSCDVCHIVYYFQIIGTVFQSRDFHERGKRHQESVQKKLDEVML